MKRLIICIALFSAIITLGIIERHTVKRVCDEILLELESSKECMANDDISSAEERVSNATELFEKRSSLLEIFVNRQQLNDIDQALNELLAVSNEPSSDFYGSLVAAENSVIRLKNEDAIKFVNLF